VGAAAEQKLTTLSSGAAEVAPSFARAKTGQRLASPTLSRFNAYWLRLGTTLTGVETVGVNAHRGLTVKHADRRLTGQVTSLSITNIPTLYTNADGVQHIDPKLTFAETGLSLGA
jgi:hypothetical protein